MLSFLAFLHQALSHHCAFVQAILYLECFSISLDEHRIYLSRSNSINTSFHKPSLILPFLQTPNSICNKLTCFLFCTLQECFIHIPYYSNCFLCWCLLSMFAYFSRLQSTNGCCCITSVLLFLARRKCLLKTHTNLKAT